MVSYLDFSFYVEVNGQNHILFWLLQVLKEKCSMTFSHFQIIFQPAGICVSPVILGSRRENAYLLNWTRQRFLKSIPYLDSWIINGP